MHRVTAWITSMPYLSHRYRPSVIAAMTERGKQSTRSTTNRRNCLDGVAEMTNGKTEREIGWKSSRIEAEQGVDASYLIYTRRTQRNASQSPAPSQKRAPSQRHAFPRAACHTRTPPRRRLSAPMISARRGRRRRKQPRQPARQGAERRRATGTRGGSRRRISRCRFLRAAATAGFRGSALQHPLTAWIEGRRRLR